MPKRTQRILACWCVLLGCSACGSKENAGTAGSAAVVMAGPSGTSGAGIAAPKNMPSGAAGQNDAAAGKAGMVAPMSPIGASGSGAGSPAAAGSGMTTQAGAGAGGEGGAPAMPSASADPDPSPGCMGGTLMPGESTLMLMSGGKQRTYVQHIPKMYDGKKPMPLVLDLHGGSYDGPRWVSVTGFRELGETEGFMVLYPSGTDNSWQATDATSSDGQFVRDLVAEIGKTGCIDRKRVYSTGCSMGGAMSFWMGCFASDLIAAIAPNCGTPFFKLDMCKPKHPISVMLTIGETDNLNCWDGMPGSVGNPCAKEVQSYFKMLDSCTGDIQKTHNDVCETIDQCAQDTEVTICKTNTGHGVYVATNLKVTEESWKFLKRFYLR
jgi:poly(3-hydroxybutyrate) depolymerase